MQTNLLQYLEQTVQRIPSAIAFADENEQINFETLYNESYKIASALYPYLMKNRMVAVLTRRNVRSIKGFLAALACGGCYIPVDADMPRTRMLSVFEQISPAVILYGNEDKTLADELSVKWNTVPLEITDNSNIIWDKLDAARKKVLDIDPAYVIFTSGSTGTPKGILVSHRSVIDFTDWYADITGVDDADHIANQAPFFFDLSVKDIYLTLKTGAATYILPKKDFSFPILLVQDLNNYHITTLSWATSAFHLTAASGVFKKHIPQYLKRVLLGGEALQAKLLNIWRTALPDVQYVNLYGPTEVTVDCTWYPIVKEFSDNEQIPIGKACSNMEVFLLDENGNEVSDGDIGEICVRGSGLAIGYFGDHEKTQRAFVQNPLNHNYFDRMYRTGDYGRKNDDADIIFVSREDDQIKHLGYRIELGEIESTIYGISEINAAVCLYHKDTDKLICIYQGNLSQEILAKDLRGLLPKYMIPNKYFQLDEFPYTANGKIDRVALKSKFL